ncbi:ATP-dependent protease-like protein [Hyphomicrobium denitrificans 1NES1]|uniref:ATP-dependent protease-like protein n=1 Tax=Hyphomicrobium denitrificans 1NES1 TaxID=670307 RepID=N0B1X6_9HYPH|nr:AAA family ATPase [Hyphomicrobium denitrificans]AGK56207.1 ATP-dependent protease-like protein [Hyphomicrobium denitrificans 1NES1]
MVFWRNRSAKKAETPVVTEERSSEPAAQTEPASKQSPESPPQPPPQTNVVTLVTTRLADRLAGVASTAGQIEVQDTKQIKPPQVPTEPSPIAPVEQPHVFGQKRAVAKIRAALSAKPGEHVLILGEPGTGRLTLAEELAAETARKAADDWIYVIGRQTPTRAKAFAVPSGKAADLVRDLRIAVERATIAFERHIKSDEHRISLDLLEEEIRYLGDKAVDEVRRRAESQNIAVVKSLDGYVLAPMHEGRVVRSDVFRALPEALKRNVEAKITTLEGELQSIVATLPDVEFEASEKYEALVRQTALRAIRPSLVALKRSYTEDLSIVAAIDAIEEAFVESSTSGGAVGLSAAVPLNFAADDSIELRKVVTVRHVSPVDLLGEIGRDALGRPAHVPGHLARAGSGFVIIEAWRLAANPKAWSALSAVLASREITPISGPGISIKADPVPLAATLILVADDQSWSKLEAIEPGIVKHFPHVAKLNSTAPLADMPENEFSKGAARLASDHALRPLAPSVAPIIYKDAIRRGGGRVSLSRTTLLHLLKDADVVAGKRDASQIRASDVTEALAHRADGDAL